MSMGRHPSDGRQLIALVDLDFDKAVEVLKLIEGNPLPQGLKIFTCESLPALVQDRSERDSSYGRGGGGSSYGRGGGGAAAIEEEAHRIRAEEVEKGDTEGEGTEEGVGVVIVPTEEGVGVEEETVPTEVAAGPATEEGEEGAHLLPPGELGREARNLTPTALLYVYTVP